MRSLARPATHGTCPRHAVGPLGARRPPWPRGRCGSQRGATSAEACGNRPVSVRSWGCVRPLEEWPAGPGHCPLPVCRLKAPWPATWGTWPSFLDTQAGQHPGDPISIPAPRQPYVQSVDRPVAPRRVAFSPDLGIARVDGEVREICAAAAHLFEGMGAVVEEACIDLGHAEETFQTLRAVQFVASYSDLLEHHRDELKPEVIWNIEKGYALTAREIAEAELARGALYHRAAQFFETYDILVCPTVAVPPFDVDLRYVDEINGVRMDNYMSWLLITFSISLTACPAISVPCGFTRGGLPVGLQIVGSRAREDLLLGAAALFEEAVGLAERVPMDPRQQ